MRIANWNGPGHGYTPQRFQYLRLLSVVLVGVTSGCALLTSQRAPRRQPPLHSAASASATPSTGLAPGYRPALPGYRFGFPRDHAAHPEYQTEWWYYTGHLKGGGRSFGFELTFFQVGIDPR